MVSFDVVLLFIRVSMKDTMDLLGRHVEEDVLGLFYDVLGLFYDVLTTSYVTFNK
jgi:hypothetical protein